MKAFILAAGLGKRMRPLTLDTPKPLLKVKGQSLIERLIAKLRDIGIQDYVINCSWKAQQLMEALGDGQRLGVHIQWSYEEPPLGTAGALRKAAPLLGEQPFILHNSDVWSDFPYSKLLQPLNDRQEGHLILVPNPDHHRKGDFELKKSGLLVQGAQATSTYSGIALLHPQCISSFPAKKPVFSLREVFAYSSLHHRLTGEIHTGSWFDVGTLDRLQQLETYLIDNKIT